MPRGSVTSIRRSSAPPASSSSHTPIAARRWGVVPRSRERRSQYASTSGASWLSLSTNHEAVSLPGLVRAARASSSPSRAVPMPSKRESRA
eukprot:2231550-Alexandrium_andersonii.AAC.1